MLFAKRLNSSIVKCGILDIHALVKEAKQPFTDNVYSFTEKPDGTQLKKLRSMTVKQFKKENLAWLLPDMFIRKYFSTKVIKSFLDRKRDTNKYNVGAVLNIAGKVYVYMGKGSFKANISTSKTAYMYIPLSDLSEKTTALHSVSMTRKEYAKQSGYVHIEGKEITFADGSQIILK